LRGPRFHLQLSMDKPEKLRPYDLDIETSEGEALPIKSDKDIHRLLKEYEKRLQKIELWQQQLGQGGFRDVLPLGGDSKRTVFRPTSPKSQISRPPTAELIGETVTAGVPSPRRSLSGGIVEEHPEEIDGNHPFSQMWMNSKLQKKEVFEQDLLQSIYDKSIERVRNKAAVFGGGLMAIMSMPFGPIGMAAGGIFGAVVGMLVGTCLDRRRHHRNIQQSELEMRRLKSLVRWSAERFADEDDPDASVKHMEMVVLEFRPIADIALASKNARKTLQLLDSWAARRSMMRQLWVYMDNILMNWKHLTQGEFFRSMQVLQTLLTMYRCSSRVLAEPEENFVLRVERLLANSSVRYILQQHQMAKQPQGAEVMESMIYADSSRKRRSHSKSRQLDEDEEGEEDVELISNVGLRPHLGLSISEASVDLRSEASERRVVEDRRVLKSPFFKSWEDFMDFDNNYKNKIPITQSDFMLLLEKEAQGMQGWDLCVDRKEIKVAKTIQSDGSGCVFLRAWSTLPEVEPEVVFHMFHKCEKRMQWDRAFFDMKVVENIEGSDILYSVLRVPAFTSRDYVQYRRAKVLEDGTILISLRSALHPDLPEKSGMIRAESFTSGYVIRSYTEGSERGTKIFLMTCTDVKGIIPKFIINFVAPRKPGEWIECLKKACLEYQAANPDFAHLKEDLEPYTKYHPFDFEDCDEAVPPASPGAESTLVEEATRVGL